MPRFLLKLYSAWIPYAQFWNCYDLLFQLVPRYFKAALIYSTNIMRYRQIIIGSQQGVKNSSSKL